MSDSDHFDPFRFEYKIAPKPVEGPLLCEIIDVKERSDIVESTNVSAITATKYRLWKALAVVVFLLLLVLSALSPQPSQYNRSLPPPLGKQGLAP